MPGSGDSNQLNVQYQTDIDNASLPANDMIALASQIIKLTEVGAGVCFGGSAASMGGVGRTAETNIITGANYNQVDDFKNQLTTAVAAISMSQGRLEHDASSIANTIILKSGKIISGIQRNPLVAPTDPNSYLSTDYSTTLPLPKNSDKISFRFTPKFTNTATNVTIQIIDYNASAVPVFIGNETSYSVIPVNYLKPNQEIEIRTGKYLSSAPSTYSDCFYISEYNIGITGEYKLIARTNDYGNWLICDGRAISRTQYSNLFTAIGSAFGSGDGSTTFNIPDLRGKVAGGIGQGSGLTNRTLGNNVGAETHTLDINQMPSHRHSMSIVNIGSTIGNLATNTNGSGTFTTTYTDYTGGGQSHNNMQPTLFAGNYFIYAG